MNQGDNPRFSENRPKLSPQPPKRSRPCPHGDSAWPRPGKPCTTRAVPDPVPALHGFQWRPPDSTAAPMRTTYSLLMHVSPDHAALLATKTEQLLETRESPLSTGICIRQLPFIYKRKIVFEGPELGLRSELSCHPRLFPPSHSFGRFTAIRSRRRRCG